MGHDGTQKSKLIHTEHDAQAQVHWGLTNNNGDMLGIYD